MQLTNDVTGATEKGRVTPLEAKAVKALEALPLGKWLSSKQLAKRVGVHISSLRQHTASPPLSLLMAEKGRGGFPSKFVSPDTMAELGQEQKEGNL